MAKRIYKELYTDGAFSGKSKVGGFAALVPSTGEAVCGNVTDTTNNRMEILAVTQGLANIEDPDHVKVFSDSQYVTKTFTNGRIRNWQRNNWKTREGKPVANKDAWEDLLKEIDRHKSVKFQWVRGHNGDEFNECADVLATSIAKHKS